MGETSNDVVKSQQGINSIEVGLKVVKVLVHKGGPAALREIAEAAGMHPAKVHRYLVSLIRGGMVRQDPETGHYDMGPYALEMSLACVARLDAVRIGTAALEDLVARTRESVFLTVWGASGPVVVDWRPARRPIAASTRTGTVFPLLGSTTGRTYAAHLPEATVAPLIDRELANPTPAQRAKGPRNHDEVRALFADIRARGMARGLGMRLPGINSFSAPVFNHRSEVAFVLTVFGYEDHFDTRWDGNIARVLAATTRELSQRLGHPQAGLRQQPLAHQH